ncbi:MAG: FAD:protein FMN transferase [Bacilli bacterium]|nr:FAD:protein FMN transferase [Bacilli bacterium]
MKFIIEKRNYIILFLIVILVLWLGVMKKNRVFLKSFNFNDKTITVAIYDKVDTKKVSNRIYKIYNKYEKTKYLDEVSYGSESLFGVEDENIIFSFATNDVLDYLKGEKIEKYIINADGNVVTGKRYGMNKYNISISDPNSGEILKIVSLENQSMVTVNDGIYDTMVVIGNNIVETTITAQNIKNSNTKEGKDYVLKHDSNAFWYINKEIFMTENFKNYIV